MAAFSGMRNDLVLMEIPFPQVTEHGDQSVHSEASHPGKVWSSKAEEMKNLANFRLHGSKSYLGFKEVETMIKTPLKVQCIPFTSSGAPIWTMFHPLDMHERERGNVEQETRKGEHMRQFLPSLHHSLQNTT